MEQYLVLIDQYLVLWTFVSVLIFFLWALIMGDPETTSLSDNILTVICCILGLPVTIFILIIMAVLEVVIKIKAKH
jgi:hypothetical protein